MGRPPCCDKSNVKRGLWTAEEDAKILAYVAAHGVGNWTLVPKKAGLNRCGKSCRLRWTNYLRPDLNHNSFTPQEEDLILRLHQAIGNRWSIIANQLPGRTDNDVKNYWNTKLSKKLIKMGIDPITHRPFSQIFADFGNIRFRIGAPLLDPEPSSSVITATPGGTVPRTTFPSPASAAATAADYALPHYQFINSLEEVVQQRRLYRDVQASPQSSSSSSCSIIAQLNASTEQIVAASPSDPLPILQKNINEAENGNRGVSCGVEGDAAGSSSSALSSFMESILDGDSKMRIEFPEVPFMGDSFWC